jgi:hypothetical protein
MTRGDRVTRRYMGNPVNRDLQTQDGWFKYRRLQDQIWYRVAQMMQLDRPPALRNPQLRELVDARVSYATSLPVEPQAAWFRLDESEYFVAISISVPCRALTYRADNGIQTATVDLYGRVTGIDGRIYREFDDQLHVRYPPEQLSRHAYEQSIYQKALRLPAGRFRIDLLVKDQGTHVGLATLAVSIPRPAAGPGLELSPVVVAKHLRRLVGVPADVTPFVIGNVKVVPAFDRTFGPDDAVGVYLQAYGFQVDPTTQSAAVKVRYEISNRQGKTLRLYDDDGGRSHWLQGLGRLVVARELPLMGLPAGDYLLTIHVGDAIGGTEKSTSAAFKVA